MDEPPLISILTVTLNSLTGLMATAESIAAQTFRDFEHVVVDGGSTDGTVEWLETTRLPIRWISEPDGGIADAMNKGLQMSTGDWILVVQAADALKSASTLSEAIRELDPSFDLVCFDVEFVMAHGMRRLRSRGFSPRLNFKPFPHQGTLTKRTLFERAGFFDEGLRLHMDYDFYLRSYRMGARSKSTGILLTSMPDNGVTSRRDWGSLRERFSEERKIHRRHQDSAGLGIVYTVAWPLYLSYRRIRAYVAEARWIRSGSRANR